MENKIYAIKHISGKYLKLIYCDSFNTKSHVSLVDNEINTFDSKENAQSYIDSGNELFYTYHEHLKIEDLEIVPYIVRNTKQFIISSAVWYNDGLIYQNQPENITSGLVVCGRRHKNCFYTLQLLSKDISIVKPLEVGFLTNDNIFVTRAEAFVIAKNANQLLQPQLYSENDSENILTSECIFQMLENEN